MPKIEVWQCPKTGELFTDKKKYREHLREKASERIVNRKVMRFADGILHDLHRRSSFEEIAEWIIANGSLLAIRARFREIQQYGQFNKKEYPYFVIKSARFTNIRWDDHCSNSRNAPHNGVENFSNRESNGLPTGYPGWKAKLVLTYEGYYITRMFEGTRICAGSGSGGRTTFISEVTLFRDDWTNLFVMEQLKN